MSLEKTDASDVPARYVARSTLQALNVSFVWSSFRGRREIWDFFIKAHFRLQAGGKPNLSFSEFERRISASGTFSASAREQTEFKLQRFRAPNFGVRHIFGVRLGADRI